MPDNVKISLNPKGYISSVTEKLDALLTDFYSAEYSQSTLYKGNVASIQWIFQHKRNDPSGTADLIQRTLTTYLGRYFHEVFVSCTQATDKSTDNRAAVRLAITVKSQTGETATVYNIVKMLNSKFIQVIKENNGL